MSILIFLLVLFVLILVHEWGHFIIAKKTGMRVDEFGIGFPPKLFGIKKGETEYTFNALPIGGFVRIFGEDGANAPSSPVHDEIMEDRSERSEAGLGGDNEDYSRSFVSKNKLSQAAVLIAGVTMNVILAWVLFVVVFAVGVPTSVEESEATKNAQLLVSDVFEGSPAQLAGIPQGAIIKEVKSGQDKDQILYPTTFGEFTKDHEGVEVVITYKVGDEQISTTLVPSKNVLDSNSDQVAVGVALTLVETVRSPIHIAIYKGFESTITGLKAITVGLSTLLYNSILGKADFSQIAGPVGIVGLVGDAASFGITSLLMFAAFISLNLAVINLLPFPALDGGRLLFVGIEAVTRRPINPVWAARLNFAGFALLMLLMIAVTYNDILRIL